MAPYDAVVVGAGPNGLTAAIVLARAGLSVAVVEGASVIGGGTRTEELTRPGFLHDVCSAVHPLGVGSPIFSALPLEAYGLEWIEPPFALVHPFDDRPPAIFQRDLDATAKEFGGDAEAYRDLVGPIASQWDRLAPDVLAPLHWPAHPVRYARFGLHAPQPAEWLVKRRFKHPTLRAMTAGIAAHALQPISKLGT